MALTNDELRKLAVDILKAPTARDTQRTIGASNLANGCDYCLASNFLGDMRETPMLDRAYLGRVWGTAIHALKEGRLKNWLAIVRKARREGWDEVKFQSVNALARRYPGMQVEKRMTLGTIKGYGRVGSTADLFIPEEGDLLDWKGSKRKDILLLIDFLEMQAGREPIFGRTHADIKLSEKEYASQMAKMEYKVIGYYAQLHLYGMGKSRQGYDVQQLSNVFIARDGTGWFDNPGLDGWEDARKKHDIYVLSFPFDPNYAQSVWDRGVKIWEKLQAGATPEDFEHNEHCFPCSLDAREAEKVAEIPALKVA